MRDRNRGGFDRHAGRSDDFSERRHRHDHHHEKHGHRGEGRRLFDYGELRLLVLALIAEHPRHGYELIKAIEERFGGAYSPSPGVIYPTLSWLDDMGYAAIDTEGANRKSYRITEEGQAFLAANRAAADALLSRTGPQGIGEVPAAVIRGMENLKVAVRLRLKRGALDETATQAIAAALDDAAQKVEKS
jgi:DNA-binding PadR family transcriptional regulator